MLGMVNRGLGDGSEGLDSGWLASGNRPAYTPVGAPLRALMTCPKEEPGAEPGGRLLQAMVTHVEWWNLPTSLEAYLEEPTTGKPKKKAAKKRKRKKKRSLTPRQIPPPLVVPLAAYWPA